MIYLLDVIACGLVVFAELVGVILLGLLIQFIFYRFFKINLFKTIIKALDRLDKKLSI